MQRCSCGCYWPARRNSRCDLTLVQRMGVPESLFDSAPRSVCLCKFGGGRPWGAHPTYQRCGGGHGRLYASARSLPLANSHALRPLDGERPVQPGSCFVWIGSAEPPSLAITKSQSLQATSGRACLASTKYNWTLPFPGSREQPQQRRESTQYSTTLRTDDSTTGQRAVDKDGH